MRAACGRVFKHGNNVEIHEMNCKLCAETYKSGNIPPVSLCGRRFKTHAGVEIHESVCTLCQDERRMLELPTEKFSLTREDCEAQARGERVAREVIPTLERGARTRARKALSTDFVQGITTRRCPTCGRSMFIKHFRKHAIEGCKAQETYGCL